MRDNGCSGCKYEHLKGSEKPCCDCANMHMDKYEPITNADRIRNMSDEELADWLHNMCDFEKNEEPYKSIYNLDTEKEEEIYDSYGSLLEWLQSEAE